MSPPPPLLLALGDRRASLAAATTPWGLADEFVSAAMEVFPWNPARAARIADLERRAPALVAAAEGWLGEAADHPRVGAFRPADQGWVDIWHRNRRPGEALLAPPSADVWDVAVFALYGGFATTTLVQDDIWPVPEEVRTPAGAPVWRLEIDPSARVLDLRTADDWAALVERHPRRLTTAPVEIGPGLRVGAPCYGVDWHAAAREWDGVRLSLEGLARILFVEVPVLDGVTCLVLSDGFWERTTWLRWRVCDIRPLGARIDRRG